MLRLATQHREQDREALVAASRLTPREREVLRETRTQIMMGVLSAAQAEANLSRLIQWRDAEPSGLPADIVARLR